MKNKKPSWFLWALTTTIFWGIWGAFTETSVYSGTIIYIIWALTMIVPAFFALKSINWKVDVDRKSILQGLIIGLLGSGGQLILFTGAIEHGPAYLIFPIISLSPVITILLSVLFLKEKSSNRGWLGITLALISIPLLSYQDPESATNDYLWLVFALLVFIAWGLQAFFMKSANYSMKAESIFFYMTISGLLLIPVVLIMSDKTELSNFNWNWTSIGYTALIQLLNAAGAFAIVYAFRYGKAIVVSPLTNAVAPVITIVISLNIYNYFPHIYVLIGMTISILAMLVLALEDDA